MPGFPWVYDIPGYNLYVATNMLYILVPLPSNFQKLEGNGTQDKSR